MRISVLLAVCAIGWGLTAPRAFAQRGVGDATGVARQAVNLKTVSLKGELVAVETGVCKNTTGRAPSGVHILLKVRHGEQLNVHLGPKTELRPVVERLEAGQKVTVQAFRTEKMAEGHYVAISLKLGDETIQLRDEMHRPVWANAGPAGRGRGPARFGRGGRCGQCPAAGRCPRAGLGPATTQCPCTGQCPLAGQCPRAGQCPNAGPCPNAKQCPNAGRCAGGCPRCGVSPAGSGLSGAAGDLDLPPLPRKKS